MEVPTWGLILQRNIAGKKLGSAMRDTAEKPVGANGSSDRGDMNVQGKIVHEGVTGDGGWMRLLVGQDSQR